MQYRMPEMPQEFFIIKDFEEHGWKIPQTWSELMNLCDEIQAAGLQPFTMGFKDTWTCLAPWNGLAVDLAPSDVCRQVNQGKTTFTENYREVAEKCCSCFHTDRRIRLLITTTMPVQRLQEERQSCIRSEAMRYLRFSQ